MDTSVPAFQMLIIYLKNCLIELVFPKLRRQEYEEM